MISFKTTVVTLMTLCLMLLCGQPGVCTADETGLLDYGAYWMPLTIGNTKTFVSSNPQDGSTQQYTEAVTGPEIIKGLEAVKLEVTESEIQYGTKTQGSYIALLPDQSQGKTILKRYLASDPSLGPYYSLGTPFSVTPRYVRRVVGVPWQSTFPSTIIKQVGRRKTAIDTCITIVTITPLETEDATVPAGTFQDCLKTRVQLSITYAQTPKNNMSYDMIVWEAKGLGEVRTEYLGILFGNDADTFPYNSILSGEVIELESASINGVEYPQ
ncbi:hypothetical protein ACFL43_04770 [Thermodesulfobacteriota bacterium]